MKSVRYYNEHAQELNEFYSGISSITVHSPWKRHLPQRAGLACDIGAGTGRDANWLAEQGWDVIAVEPSDAMRDIAITNSHPNVTWLNDALPKLDTLRNLGHRFDLILLSAVWMHVTPSQRERAFRILTELLGPGGVLVISLRHSTDEVENQQRTFHPVSVNELELYAQQRAVSVAECYKHADLSRKHVTWETVVLRMPDDGTGSLPLLRHVIVNDNKSSSYKLGLLRALTRIAECAPGIVQTRDEDSIDIPFGIVGLYWLKQYKPLVLTHEIQQHPNLKLGMGFAKADFYALRDVSGYDLRIGARFQGELASVVTGAIRDACVNIAAMPARYITYPGQNRPLFDCETKTVRKGPGPIVLDVSYLQQFGTFRVPRQLWQTLGQYACWLEPAILREWSGLTQRWGVGEYARPDPGVFDWEEGRRDTSLVARRIHAMHDNGEHLNCVWSDRRLRNVHIDHCFPWSRWFNNDLWNLLPTNAQVNISKGDKLPSGQLMHEARKRIEHWWQSAYVESDLAERFMLEAEVSLPKLTSKYYSIGHIYDAVLHQRARLKADQQLVEWSFR